MADVAEPMITTTKYQKGNIPAKPFLPGNAGRPLGSTNRLTKTVKETVLAVFNEIQDDPKVNLTAFAKKYPRDFYAIAAKLIPTEIKGDIQVNLINLNIVRKGPGPGIAATSPQPGEDTTDL